MSHPLTIQITTTGATTLVYHPNDKGADFITAGLGTITEDTRGAYVYPLHPLKRKLFKALRKRFGGVGKIADWTREWHGKWVVVLSGEHVRLPMIFKSHAAAVEAEIAWILEHRV